MRRKNHVRFGGGPTEKGQPTDWYLAGGLPYPEHPLALECFTNIGDPDQRTDFQDLSARDYLRFLFYDASLQHRLSKLVPNPDRAIISQISATAETLRARIPVGRFDFDAAKADIIKRT